MTDVAAVVTMQLDDDLAGPRLPELRWEVHDVVIAGACQVVVDVSRVRRLSSAALTVLLSAHRRCRARGGGVVIRGAGRSTLEVLHGSGLHRVFEIEDPRRPVSVADQGAGP